MQLKFDFKVNDFTNCVIDNLHAKSHFCPFERKGLLQKITKGQAEKTYLMFTRDYQLHKWTFNDM